MVLCCRQHVGSCQGFGWRLGQDTSLELGRGKGPSPWSSATPGSADSAQVDGYRMCCPSLSSSSQGYKLLLRRGNKTTAFCGCRWLRGENRFRGAGSPSASIQFLFLLTMQCRALNFCFSLEIERSTVLTQSLGTDPSPTVPDPQLTGKDTYLLLWTRLTFQIVPFYFSPLFLSPGSPDTILL